MILTPIFAFEEKGGLLATGDWTLTVAHLEDLVIVVAATFGGSYFLFWLVNKIIPLRVTPENEELGLDVSQHGEQLTVVI